MEIRLARREASALLPEFSLEDTRELLRFKLDAFLIEVAEKIKPQTFAEQAELLAIVCEVFRPKMFEIGREPIIVHLKDVGLVTIGLKRLPEGSVN